MLLDSVVVTIPDTAAAMAVQAPVHKRLEGLRQTARQLEDNSAIDQVVPVLVAIGIACLITTVLYMIYRGFAILLARYRTVKSSGLTRPQTAWLLEMAIEAEVRPPLRVLRSVRTFEQVTTSYLERQLAVADDWPEDAHILREVAWRIGTAPDEGPLAIESTRDIGAPWAIGVSAAPSEDGDPPSADRTDGFVATADVDELVVHAVNDLGQLDGLGAGSILRIHARPDTTFSPGAEEKTFESRIVRIRARGRFTLLRLAHATRAIEPASVAEAAPADDESLAAASPATDADAPPSGGENET